MWIHRITNIDETTKTADCANCGRVSVKKKPSSKNYACTIRIKNNKTNYARKKYVKYPNKPKSCEVCGDFAKRICFDHCHVTGLFRGWLCNTCNLTLGRLNDNPETLRKLADYLDNFNSQLT